jgi:hypothetical protein
LAQVIPQRVSPALQPLAHEISPPRTEHNGVGLTHAMRHDPQFVAVVKSVSHPLAAIMSQSPRSG